MAIPVRLRSLVVPARDFLLIALLAAGFCTAAHADKRTVCTITVNSPDEKEILRQRLPEDQYQFVELVERGRPDWLASACRQGVRCDLLVISGHFDDGSEFYSDRLGARESLPVAEMERVSCSDVLSGTVLAIEGGLPLRLQHAECGSRHEHDPGSRAQPRPRRVLAGRGRAHGARARPAPRREQPRPHAPHLHERARHLRLFLARAARAQRSDGPESILRIGFPDRAGQRSRQSEAPQPLCGELDDDCQRHERCGSASGLSARGLPVCR